MELDFVIHNIPVYCVNLSRENKDLLYYKLIEIIFYKNPSFVHFHSNCYDNEKMLIVSEDGFKLLEEKCTDIDFKRYKQIQIINTNAYIDEIGLVANISSLFCEKSISILYITTCQNNFIFVEENEYEEAIKILESLTDNITYV